VSCGRGEGTLAKNRKAIIVRCRVGGLVAEEVEVLVVGASLARPSLPHVRAVHLDRRKFDRYFAARAADAGAIVRGGVRLEELLSSGGVRTDTGPVPARNSEWL
jgi:hypothetical protein